MLTRYHLDHSYFGEPRRFGDFLLYQIGRQYCERDTVVEAHIHMPFFELTIVTEGHGTVITNGVGTPVSRGDIYFSLPCDTHEIHVDPDDPLQYDYVAFHCDTPALQEELLRYLNGEEGAMPLDTLATQFNNRGRYKKSPLFGYYTSLLRDAEAGDTSRLELYTRLLRLDADFCAIFTCEWAR